MEPQIYSSAILEAALEEFSKLPGIGKKSALRMVMHLLRQSKEEGKKFGDTILKLIEDIKYCQICKNISDTDICGICSNKNRNHSLICVVENIRDVISIENTQQYNGVYHVLGGIINPMEGIGPNDLTITSLEARIRSGSIQEIILALSTTMEGDTTCFYLYRKFSNYPVSISAIARGVAIGDELEYADEITLGKSIVNRLPFAQTMGNGH